MRGRKPQPTKLKILRGNPGRRALNRQEPVPPAGRPVMPEWIGRLKHGAECWSWLVDKLDEMKILSQADGKTLELYCATWSEWRQATEFVAAHGMTYPIRAGQTTTKGKVHKGAIKGVGMFPEVAIARSRAELLSRLGAELGLTPSSRTRIKVPEVPKESPLEKFLRGSG